MTNPIRYRGYYYDQETCWYYLQSRYYDPEIGRFLNADDTAYLGSSGTVLGYNAYGYCENDVVNMADPSGTDAIVLYQHKAVGIFSHVAVLIEYYEGWYSLFKGVLHKR